MGNCKDCKHWSKEDLDTYQRLAWDEYGVCQRATSHFTEPDDVNALCVAQDGEECFAQLVTKPDFGCVQFEVRPPFSFGTRLAGGVGKPENIDL